MMWYLLFLLLLYTAHVELQQVQGDKLILSDQTGQTPCEGHVEIFHEGKWGLVGDKHWNGSTEVVVCRSTHCGTPVEMSTENTFRDPNSKVWLNELYCSGKENQLWECGYPSWGESFYSKDSIKKVKCSDNISISLDEPKCAGVVKFLINGSSPGYFCANDWGKAQASLLCKSLKCGDVKEIPKLQWWDGEEFQNSKKMAVKCPDDTEQLNNLWQCAAPEPTACTNPASVICTGYERLQLRGERTNVCSGQLEMENDNNWTPVVDRELNDVWCKQMHCGTTVSHNRTTGRLTCTDSVEVVLMENGKNSNCSGVVHVRVNSTVQPVCAYNWNKKEADVVCRELNCGNAINEQKRQTKPGIIDNVDCTGKESSLWHCRAKHQNNMKCSSNAHVICSASMKVKLVDGPGRCAGRLEVEYDGQWKVVTVKDWTDTNSNVVCKQLGCGRGGKTSSPKTFAQGSFDFLTVALSCQRSDSHIAECIKSPLNISPRDNQAVGITCEDHKMVFLENACSGMVGLEHGKKIYWLSGSNNTWNQEEANSVCQQMHCGYASNVNVSSRGNIKDVWARSDNCSKPLLECHDTDLTPEPNGTVATVTCSEQTVMHLSEKCWGTVIVSVGGSKGGVCNNTWTDEFSKMLCQDQGCDDKVLRSISSSNERKVIVKSLHMTGRTTNLDQSNFILYDDPKDVSCNKNPAKVVCSGSVKIRIRPSVENCSGIVDMFYEGQWLPVCEKALKDSAIQNTICKELQCGKADKLLEHSRRAPGPYAITQIQCVPDSNSFKNCVINPDKGTCTIGVLRCTRWKRFDLKFKEKACSGQVFAFQKGTINAVSSEGWTEREGNQLCNDLNCGSFSSKELSSLKGSLWNNTFSCKNVTNPQSIWDCEQPLGNSSAQSKGIIINCQDEPKVNLSGTCAGELTIENTPVCVTHWNDTLTHLVCQEQNCGNGVSFSPREPRSDTSAYYHVSCEKYHHKLGQCVRYKDKCDGGLVSVSCSENVQFKTTENCGGQIEVNYQNRWEKVKAQLSAKFETELCHILNCGSPNASFRETINSKKVSLETELLCNKNHNMLKSCIFNKIRVQDKAAEIYCNGYKEKAPTSNDKKTSVWPILLGVGFSLVLLILIFVFIQIWKSRKAKNAFGESKQRQQFGFESGEYEDVNSKENEMEDFSQDKFISEAVVMERDVHSTSSLPYDDIDEAAETSPLTPQTPDASAGDHHPPEGADGVTYELDDPKENYDDIEAGPAPEIAQTKAEVHDAPQTPTEGISAPPVGPVTGDEDYLVPGEDG